MTVSELLQIILMVVLVVITGIYAWRTHVISKATKQQADASVKMADEMKEQILSEARPYLLLRLTDEYLQWKDGTGGKSVEEFSVTVFNGGKGPARNLEASLWSHEDIFLTDTKGYLATNQEWTATIPKSSTDQIALGEKIPHPELKDVIQRNRICVIVRYEDIHHHDWVSYLYLEDVDDTGYVREGEQNIAELKKND